MAMENLLTDAEKIFLASQGLGPDDVMDVRRMLQRHWFEKIEEEGKTVALGSRCRAALIEASKDVVLRTPWKASGRIGLYEFPDQ